MDNLGVRLERVYEFCARSQVLLRGAMRNSGLSLVEFNLAEQSFDRHMFSLRIRNIPLSV